MGKDSAARIELGRSFHQMETVNEKICESDFVPLWDGTVMRRSLAERKCHSLSPSAFCFPAHIWFSCPSFLSSLVN